MERVGRKKKLKAESKTEENFTPIDCTRECRIFKFVLFLNDNLSIITHCIIIFEPTVYNL